MAKLVEQYIHPKHPKLYLQQRSDSKFLQALTFLDGKKQQWSTKTAHLATALKLAEEEYKKRLRKTAGEPERANHLLEIPTMEELFTRYKKTLDSPKKRDYAAMKWSAMKGFRGHDPCSCADRTIEVRVISKFFE